MRLKLVLTGLAVLAVTLLPTAASAGLDDGRGTFLSLPPDLTTGYLEGHHPHKDPKHPSTTYRHRPLRTATTTASTASTASPSPSLRGISATSP
jgi:hypothetical protein